LEFFEAAAQRLQAELQRFAAGGFEGVEFDLGEALRQRREVAAEFEETLQLAELEFEFVRGLLAGGRELGEERGRVLVTARFEKGVGEQLAASRVFGRGEHLGSFGGGAGAQMSLGQSPARPR
jgi:hypothetical protein